MSAVEIIQAVVSPVEKLISTVSGAIGKIYEPCYVKKMAEAKACEINLIADAVRNNSDLPIVYDSERVSIDTSDYEKIIERTSRRLAYQELRKQQNIEAVVEKAYQELENSEPVSNEPVSEDWVSRFFSSVEDISDEKMQQIWAHILAGEVKQPNSYSFRTIEKLKNMTRKEAELFQKVSALLLQNINTMFIVSYNNILNKYNVYFSDILRLEECGLMSAQNLSLTINTKDQLNYIYSNSNIGFFTKSDQAKKKELKISIYKFTESGKDLIKTIKPQTNKEYFVDCLELLRNLNNDLIVTMHEINQISTGEFVNYNKEDIFPR